MIAIIDYGAGNLRSVARAFARLGYPARITSDPQDVLQAHALVLPGVGAAADAIDSLRTLHLIEPIRQAVAERKPFFGVCLGLQVLFDASEEGGYHRCLGLLPGVVRRLPPGLKVPHMGWNQVSQRISHPLFNGIAEGANFYFVHSFYADVEDTALVAGETEYQGFRFPSVLIRGTLVATQFHPEKSGDTGLRLYENWCRQIYENWCG